jgi:hypothetical protein
LLVHEDQRLQTPRRPYAQTPPPSDAARALLSPAAVTRSRPASRQRPLPNLPDPYEGLLTAAEAAALFDVTERTLRNWRWAGVLEPVRGPKARIFYRLEDLLRLLGQ